MDSYYRKSDAYATGGTVSFSQDSEEDLFDSDNDSLVSEIMHEEDEILVKLYPRRFEDSLSSSSASQSSPEPEWGMHRPDEFVEGSSKSSVAQPPAYSLTSQFPFPPTSNALGDFNSGFTLSYEDATQHNSYNVTSHTDLQLHDSFHTPRTLDQQPQMLQVQQFLPGAEYQGEPMQMTSDFPVGSLPYIFTEEERLLYSLDNLLFPPNALSFQGPQIQLHEPRQIVPLPTLAMAPTFEYPCKVPLPSKLWAHEDPYTRPPLGYIGQALAPEATFPIAPIPTGSMSWAPAQIGQSASGYENMENKVPVADVMRKSRKGKGRTSQDIFSNLWSQAGQIAQSHYQARGDPPIEGMVTMHEPIENIPVEDILLHPEAEYEIQEETHHGGPSRTRRRRAAPLNSSRQAEKRTRNTQRSKEMPMVEPEFYPPGWLSFRELDALQQQRPIKCQILRGAGVWGLLTPDSDGTLFQAEVNEEGRKMLCDAPAFSTILAYQAHIEEVHRMTTKKSKNNPCECAWDGCATKENLSSEGVYTRHLLSRHAHLVWMCPHRGCEKDFTRENVFDRHFKTVHPEEWEVAKKTCTNLFAMSKV